MIRPVPRKLNFRGIRLFNFLTFGHLWQDRRVPNSDFGHYKSQSWIFKILLGGPNHQGRRFMTSDQQSLFRTNKCTLHENPTTNLLLDRLLEPCSSHLANRLLWKFAFACHQYYGSGNKRLSGCTEYSYRNCCSLPLSQCLCYIQWRLLLIITFNNQIFIRTLVPSGIWCSISNCRFAWSYWPYPMSVSSPRSSYI